jgi:hypothetical protein
LLYKDLFFTEELSLKYATQTGEEEGVPCVDIVEGGGEFFSKVELQGLLATLYN